MNKIGQAYKVLHGRERERSPLAIVGAERLADMQALFIGGIGYVVRQIGRIRCLCLPKPVAVGQPAKEAVLGRKLRVSVGGDVRPQKAGHVHGPPVSHRRRRAWGGLWRARVPVPSRDGGSTGNHYFQTGDTRARRMRGGEGSSRSALPVLQFLGIRWRRSIAVRLPISRIIVPDGLVQAIVIVVELGGDIDGDDDECSSEP